MKWHTQLQIRRRGDRYSSISVKVEACSTISDIDLRAVGTSIRQWWKHWPQRFSIELCVRYSPSSLFSSWQSHNNDITSLFIRNITSYSQLKCMNGLYYHLALDDFARALTLASAPMRSHLGLITTSNPSPWGLTSEFDLLTSAHRLTICRARCFMDGWANRRTGSLEDSTDIPLFRWYSQQLMTNNIKADKSNFRFTISLLFSFNRYQSLPP